jgi:GT2 family glycosyltransferase
VFCDRRQLVGAGAAAQAVSVIIPVYNDWSALERCLEAIRAQDYHATVEVVVVDNDSDTAPPDDLWRADIVWCTCQTPGSYAARNRGIAAASHDILAFTDADCRPQPNWLRSGVAALACDPDADALAGRVKVFAADPARPTPIETFEHWCGFGQRAYVRRGFGATANLFIRRAALEQVGLFDEGLLSGADKLWGRRLTSSGGRLVYADNAVVEHPARRTVTELRAKITRLAGGRYLAAGSRWKRLQALPIMLLPPPQPLKLVLGPKRIPLRDRCRILAVLGLIWGFKIIETMRLLSSGRILRQ